MRLEWRWPVIAIAALLVGACCAQIYVQLAAPCYRSAAVWLAQGHLWTITGVDVSEDAERPGVFIRLHGEVRAAAFTAQPSARVIGRVQAGAAIEGPLLFWTLLLAWPGTVCRRGALLLMGIPVFLGLEVATTVCQLLSGFAEASALLAGDPSSLTGWERWSRFIESGGRDVLAVCSALLTIAVARSTPWTTPASHRTTEESVRRSSCPAVSRASGFAEPPAPN
jgi:hypothetical protein